MDTIFKFLASPAGGALASFLMSEAATGVTYLTAITSGGVTVDQALLAYAKATEVFNRGDAAVDAAEKALDQRA